MIKSYVIDTNILIQAPYACQCFEENRVILPLVVLEELDGLKKAEGEKPVVLVTNGKLRGKEIKAMSEVYIRSQNKEKLYRLGGNYACVEYGEYEDIKKKRGGAEADKKRHVICISDGCLEEIGEYATKERCLEVLDEIQKACVSYLFTAGGAAVIRGGMDVQPFAAVIPRLYEMPEK